jgi:hypothetical protein
MELYCKSHSHSCLTPGIDSCSRQVNAESHDEALRVFKLSKLFYLGTWEGSA